MSESSRVVGGSVSEGVYSGWYIQWKVLDYFKVVKIFRGTSDPIFSPEMTSSGCKWRAALYPSGPSTTHKLYSYLWCEDKTARKKTARCSFGPLNIGLSGAKVVSEIEELYPEKSVWVFKANFDRDELEERKSELVPSDVLTITFYVEDDDPYQQKQVKQRLTGLENLSSSFKDLFVNKKKTDATVKVKEKDFPVHKTVLMARSPVFWAMFGHDTSEEKTGVVTVPDCDPDSFQDFLYHLYSGRFDRVNSSNAHHLYVTSDKYDVQSLKSFCVDHMTQNITVENVLDVVVVADRYEESEPLSAAQDFFNRNLEVIISSPRWRTLFKEDFELSNRLLRQMAQKVKVVE